MSFFYRITSNDLPITLTWWQFSGEKRANNSLLFSQASIYRTAKNIDKLHAEAEKTKDPNQKIILSSKCQDEEISLGKQEALYNKLLAIKKAQVLSQAPQKGVELLKTLEKLKKSFKESLAEYLTPLHHSISFFFLFRLFIKDRLELYAKYHPFDDSFQKQSKEIITLLCNLRCSSDNEKVQDVIDRCMDFVQKLEAALFAADAKVKTESKIWDFWKEIIQEPEFFDFKVLSFLDTTPFLISLQGIMDHYTLTCQQLLEDIPMIKDFVGLLLGSCSQDLEIKEYLGSPINEDSSISSPQELKENFFKQLDKVYTLSSKFISKAQIDAKEIISFYKELEEALSVFPTLFPNLRYLLEVIETKDKNQRTEIASKYDCETDLEEKKFTNLQIYQQIHNICDSLLTSPHSPAEAYVQALKTEKIKAKNLPIVSVSKENPSLSPKLKGLYSRTLHDPELGKEIQQFRLPHRQITTECGKHANLYLGYIQGLLGSKTELTDYRSFVHTSVLLLESCYYALEQTAGDLSKEKLNFHGLVARYHSLKISDPLLEELNLVPHWIHYLYNEIASFQSITTIRSVQQPPLLKDLFTCLETTQQQKADQLLDNAVNYVRRTLNFIIRQYSLPKIEELEGEEQVLENVSEPIDTDPFLKLRQPIPQMILPDEKIHLQQMNLTIDLFIQSLNLLNRTSDPSLFAALVQKSSETLYRYFKQSLLLLHLKKFQSKASRDSSVVELYKKCIGPNKKINKLFAQFGLSGRYPYSIIASTCCLHALQKEAITLMETPDLDHGFSLGNGSILNSNTTRKELRIAYNDALEILTKQILPLLKN